MKRSAPYLSDPALVRDLSAAVVQEGLGTARVLDHIAEFDARRLYLPAGYSSTYTYCVGHLHLSEDAAYKRIQAARAAARFPAIFDAVAEGRMHLAGVCLLAPHLTEDTAAELLAAAERQSKAEIERILAHRFPRPDVPALVYAIPTPVIAAAELAPGQVGELRSAPERACGEPQGDSGHEAPPAAPIQLAPGQVDRSTVKPLGLGRYGVRFTIGESAHDKLRYVQELVGHEIAPREIALVFERALEAYIRELEKRRFAATDTPRPRHGRSSENPRYVPLDVKRAVWKRDQGQCTFVSDDGHRCTERRSLEFDHVLEVARGGEATVDGLRLLCRAHNQHQAERTFGAEFMRHKRIAAAEARATGDTAQRDARPAPG